MSVPAYASYRDSGVEWLGEVPSHWEVGALKRQFEVCLGKMLQSEAKGPTDKLRPYLRAANIQWNVTDVSDLREMWVSPSEAEALALLPGDLLVSEGGDVGRSAIWRGEIADCAFQNSVNRVRSLGDGDTRFLLFWMSMLKSKGFIDVICNKATIAHFTAEKVASVQVAFPPSTEQAAIAAFLERETGKIDALVEAQRRLIDLLKEKRQAVISHAVTMGLDPAAPMKDSGVEWLGEVPAHWEVTRLANLFREVAEPGDETLPVLSVSIHDGVSDEESDPDQSERKITRSEDRTKYKRVQKDDLVYNMMRAWQGGFGTVQVTGAVSPAYVVARPNRPEATRFVELLLRTPKAVEEMRRRSRGVTDFRLRLYWDEFKDMTIVMPPGPEVRDILSSVEEGSGRWERLADEAESAILLLQERRAALISAAVTGKIDVRGLVADRIDRSAA